MIIYAIISGILILLLLVRLAQLYHHVLLIDKTIQHQNNTAKFQSQTMGVVLDQINTVTDSMIKDKAMLRIHDEYMRKNPEYMEYVREKLVNMEIDEMTGGE